MRHRAFRIVLAPGQNFWFSSLNTFKACGEQVLSAQFATLKQASGGAGSEAGEVVVGEGHGAVQKV
ncbi:hypothetical protein [Pseudomonas abietaniphila]|uniref:hypothetical protein n=1 Tax=Pseudomonas abietaniphila TaxID=89065 RepID=UPI001FC9EA62|nr:hypothetical protein [Pseudomonas abietaniphila]